MRLAIAAALIGAAAASAALTVALAQQPASQPAQTIRLRGVIEKLDGRAVLAELKLNLVDVAPSPIFPWLKRFDDRMLAGVKVLGGVFVL